MPPVPTSSSSSYRSATVSPTTAESYPPGTALSGRTERCLESVFPGPERLVQLRVGDHERHEDADAVRVDPRFEEQQAALGGGFDDPGGELGGRLLRAAVPNQLDRQHRAEAADVADRLPASL